MRSHLHKKESSTAAADTTTGARVPLLAYGGQWPNSADYGWRVAQRLHVRLLGQVSAGKAAEWMLWCSIKVEKSWKPYINGESKGRENAVAMWESAQSQGNKRELVWAQTSSQAGPPPEVHAGMGTALVTDWGWVWHTKAVKWAEQNWLESRDCSRVQFWLQAEVHIHRALS